MHELLDLDAAGEDGISNDLDEDTAEVLLCGQAACMYINEPMYVISHWATYAPAITKKQTLWLKITGGCAARSSIGHPKSSQSFDRR